MKERLKGIVFSLLVVAFGAVVAVAGNFMGGQAREVRGWPTVEGTLLKADTERQGMSDEPRVIPQIRYEYVVDGDKYTSTSFEPGYTYYERRSEITHEINPFEEGASVTVYHNPAQPAEAYLTARPRGGLVVLAGYGVGILGILMLVLSLFGKVKVNALAESPQ